MDGGQEVAGGFVVAGGDCPELFEFGEEILNQMARLVEVPIVVPRHAAIGFGGNDGRFAGLGQRFDDPLVGIERLVADQHVGLHVWQEVVSTDEIVRLATGEEEGDRVAQRIDQRVDLGAQSAARAPDRLVFFGFFLAPALC